MKLGIFILCALLLVGCSNEISKKRRAYHQAQMARCETLGGVAVTHPTSGRLLRCDFPYMKMENK